MTLEIPHLQVLVFGLVFDVALSLVFVVHIRRINALGAQIKAIEASTDLLLTMQRDLNKVIIAFLSK